jgi:hypothetical protein
VKCVDGEGYLGEVFFWSEESKKMFRNGILQREPPKFTRFQVQSDKAKTTLLQSFLLSKQSSYTHRLLLHR